MLKSALTLKFRGTRDDPLKLDLFFLLMHIFILISLTLTRPLRRKLRMQGEGFLMSIFWNILIFYIKICFESGGL